MKKWLPLLLPIGLLAVLATVLMSIDDAYSLLSYPSFRILPYLLTGLGFILGILFLQSRISFICLFLAIVTFYLDRTFALEGMSSKCEAIIFLASIYVPVFGLLFYHLGERGLFTTDGYVRLIIVLSGVVVLLLVPNIVDMSKTISSTGISLFRPVSDWLRIPMAGLLVMLLCMPFFIVRSGFESPLLGPFIMTSVCFTFLGLNLNASFWPEGSRRVVFLSSMSGAALTLTWSVLESTWRNAHIDELTELPGRRSLKHHLARLGGQYAIAMIDVDHFKRVNDRYGHDTGDQVLRFIASCLRRNAAGKAYRYGGEEFAVICSGADFKDTVEALDDLRDTISKRPFILRSRLRPKKVSEEKAATKRVGVSRGAKINITVSIGAARSGGRYNTTHEVIEAADKALYRAKRAGRNRVSANKQ